MFFVWSLFYVLYMVPRLGPDKDVDLFFSAYLIFAFFAGMLVEGFSRKYRTLVVMICGFGAAIGYFGLMNLQV